MERLLRTEEYKRHTINAYHYDNEEKYPYWVKVFIKGKEYQKCSDKEEHITPMIQMAKLTIDYIYKQGVYKGRKD